MDTVAFSNRFAEVLSAEYARRGILTDRGPSLGVEVRALSRKKGRFFKTSVCFLEVLVYIGSETVPPAGRGQGKKKKPLSDWGVH